MRKVMRRRSFVIALAVYAAVPCAASAQVRDRAAPPPAAAASDASALAAGWTAVSARRFDEAAKISRTILTRRPWDRAAVVLEITALSGSAPLRGLDAYEQWLGGKRADDAGLLEPVAIATLQDIAGARDPEMQRAALVALAASRVEGARDRLAALPVTQENAIARDVAAARAGDAEAVTRLTAAAATPAGGTQFLATALAELGSSGEPGLIHLAGSTNRQVRTAAAKALGIQKTDPSRAALQGLMKDPDPLVRLWATVSLARHGDDQALSQVEQMLASPAPDVQLAAAEAWEGRQGPWIAAIRPLLDNPDGLVRLDAARIIAPVDPDAARRVLDAALGDPNPVVRLESAKAADSLVESHRTLFDLPTLRQRLRDSDPHVRLAVASALLKLARSS